MRRNEKNMNETTYLIEARDLYKYYDRRKPPALNGLTLQIPSGRIIGLLGPNGSGKTTFIKLLNGLLTPTYGTLTVAGQAPGLASKAMVSYLPDRTCLQSSLRIQELLCFFSDFYADFSTEKARQMLSSLEIDPTARLSTLSKGTWEKVQLALVMSRNARLYVLDEPIAGVDPAARDYVLRTILSNYCQDATVLISTHLIADVEKLLDDAIFIQNGTMLLYAPAEQIREEQGKSLDTYFREVFAC